jgi:hypothetical protein
VYWIVVYLISPYNICIIFLFTFYIFQLSQCVTKFTCILLLDILFRFILCGRHAIWTAWCFQQARIRVPPFTVKDGIWRMLNVCYSGSHRSFAARNVDHNVTVECCGCLRSIGQKLKSEKRSQTLEGTDRTMTAGTLLFQESREKREYPVLRQYENGQQQMQLRVSVPQHTSPQVQVTEWSKNMLDAGPVW